MNKITSTAMVLAVAVLSGCGDQIPSVPDPVPENIVVSGQTLTKQQFVEKYCAGQTDNESCVKVRRAWAADSTRSKNGIPRF